MKKIFTTLSLFVLIFAFAPRANAQFSLGIKVAGNYTNYMDRSDFFYGGDAGIFMRLGDRFYFQPEVNYSFRSTNLREIVTEVSDNIRLKQHFIDVPLLLGYHFIDNENFKFHIFVGPRIGFQVGSNIGDIDALDFVSQKLQWGGQVGIGLDFWRFTLDARYDISANKFMLSNQSDGMWRQNMIVLSLGFKIVK